MTHNSPSRLVLLSRRFGTGPPTRGIFFRPAPGNRRISYSAQSAEE